MGKLKWKVQGKLKSKTKKISVDEVVRILLENRDITSTKKKEEFLNPVKPEKIKPKDLKLDSSEIKKAVTRIKKAVKTGERVYVYGDYDADGICATAILWECLYSLGVNALPYIPERFSEGYGLNIDTVRKLKKKNPDLGLIVTVDNGIVAHEAVDAINKMGVDVIITDHHQKSKGFPKALSIIHTTQISGSATAWVLANKLREIIPAKKSQISDGFELVAIGTVADQLPAVGPTRSFVKYGLEALNETSRSGIIAIFEEAGIQDKKIGSYEIGFIIAPRINAMGRLEHAIESLRLLCIRDQDKARKLAYYLGKTNQERQKVVNQVVVHAEELAGKKKWQGAIILAHQSYHEGVIGLAAAKLVEKFYRPAIVISEGVDISKASARSISGFNIIEAIRKLDHLLEDGGGHPMAAGFSIKTGRVEKFVKEFEGISSADLNDKVLTKRLRIDMEIGFDSVTWDLYDELQKFEPTGLGNPTPVFSTSDVEVLDARTVGKDGKHLKLKLKKEGDVINAIAFGFGHIYKDLLNNDKVDVAYVLAENIWNGERNLELKIRDIKHK